MRGMIPFAAESPLQSSPSDRRRRNARGQFYRMACGTSYVPQEHRYLCAPEFRQPVAETPDYGFGLILAVHQGR